MATKNLGLVKALFVGSVAPSNTNVTWRDTNVNKIKYYDPIVPGWVAMDAGSATAIWGNVQGILSNQTDLQNALTNLQNQINNNGNSISTLQGNITTINNSISTQQTAIGALQSQAHNPNQDDFLDQGGANEVSAADIKAFIASKGQINGLSTLGSDGKIPLSQLPAAIVGALQFQGTWNATSNTPALSSGIGTKGYFYVVSVAGNATVDGLTDWQIGDWIVFDGTVWRKIDNSDKVTSVNGQSGIVTLTSSHIAEGSNLYYTESRVNANANVVANTAARHTKDADQFFLPGVANESGLRLVPTVGLAVNKHIAYRDDTDGSLKVYKLFAGAIVDNPPSVVVPGDYVDPGNAKHWRLAAVGTGGGSGGGDMFKSVYDPGDTGKVVAARSSDIASFLNQPIGDFVTLKAIPTVGSPNGASLNSYILYRETSSGILRVYKLTSGTEAESTPEIVRPDDYAGTTNERVWKLCELVQDVSHVSDIKTSVAHGFLTGDVLRVTGSNTYAKISDPTTQIPVGIVIKIDDDNYELVSNGFVQGLSGLTAGSTYYVQATGVLGTTATAIKYFVAVTTTSGYLLSVGGSGGGTQDLASVLGNGANASGVQITNLGAPTNATSADRPQERDAAITSAVTTLKGGVVTAGDTLAKLYALITAVGRPRGGFDASSGAVPSNTPVIEEGDYWRITVAGTIAGLLSGATSLKPGDLLIANADGATAANQFYSIQSNVDQADETTLGLAKTSTQAIIETEGTTNITDIVTPQRFWQGLARFKALAQVFTSSLKAKQIAGDIGTLTDAATVTWDAATVGNTAQLTIGGNRTLAAITNPVTGAHYTLIVTQDGTGNRTLGFNAAYLFGNAVTPYLNLGAGEITRYEFVYDGTNFKYLGVNGTERVKDLLIANQVAPAGTYKCLIIDDAGKVVKEANMTYNPTTKQFTVKGLNTLSTNYSLVITDSNDEVIARFRNDKVLELGGTSAILEVNAGIPSGNAMIRFLSNQLLGYRFQDTALNDYLNFRSSTTDRGVVVRQPIEYDYGFGEKRITKQGTVTIDNGVNNGQTVLWELTLADAEHYDVKVIHADATATDGASITTLDTYAADVRKVASTNIEGNTLPAGNGTISASISRLPSSVTTGGFNWNIDTATQKLQFRFQNCSTAKTFVVWFELSYVKRITPAV